VPIDFFPPNDVEWIDPGPGLRFEHRGIAFADEARHWNSAQSGREVSVELWVRPADEPDERIGQIFAFFDGDAIDPLLIAQWKSGLVVRNRIIDDRGRQRYRELGALGMLFREQLRYIALTSGPAGTAIFLDGRETAHRSNIPVIADAEAFGGQLVFGNAPTGTAPWTGELLGAAVYRRELRPDEIAQHHAAFATSGVASLVGEAGLVALYPFDERSGQAARSRAAAGPALRVPLDFHRLRTPSFQLPNLRGRNAEWYGRDAVVNLIGFVPLGFFAVAAGRRRRLALAPAVAGALILGAALSLGIELIQVQLPARVSSATDVAFNLAGTALGAWLALALQGSIAARLFSSATADTAAQR